MGGRCLSNCSANRWDVAPLTLHVHPFPSTAWEITLIHLTRRPRCGRSMKLHEYLKIESLDRRISLHDIKNGARKKQSTLGSETVYVHKPRVAQTPRALSMPLSRCYPNSSSTN